MLIVADGPRDERENEKCLATRAIVEAIDWPCEVERNYSRTNLGCRKRIASGLDWVFERYEQAIILEDDCLPNPTFFRFADELLNRYADDPRIGQISGDNFQFGKRCCEHSYYFLRCITSGAGPRGNAPGACMMTACAAGATWHHRLAGTPPGESNLCCQHAPH